jgi:hypothetical protein
LEVIEEQTIVGSNKRPDGVLVDAFRFRYGYWEAKDAHDDLEKEIVAKQRSNYPMFNFLIENSVQAVLIQGDNKEKVEITDKQALHQLITKFIAYERTEIKEFKQAVAQFQIDLPQIIEVLREMIAKQTATNRGVIFSKDYIFTEKNNNITPLQTTKKLCPAKSTISALQTNKPKPKNSNGLKIQNYKILIFNSLSPIKMQIG